MRQFVSHEAEAGTSPDVSDTMSDTVEVGTSPDVSDTSDSGVEEDEGDASVQRRVALMHHLQELLRREEDRNANNEGESLKTVG